VAARSQGDAARVVSSSAWSWKGRHVDAFKMVPLKDFAREYDQSADGLLPHKAVSLSVAPAKPFGSRNERLVVMYVVKPRSM